MISRSLAGENLSPITAEAHDFLRAGGLLHASFKGLDRPAQLVRGKMAVPLGHGQRSMAHKLLRTIEKGKIADILIVKGNPVENIKDVKNVYMVFQNGNVIVKEKMLLFPTTYISEPIQPISNDGKA